MSEFISSDSDEFPAQSTLGGRTDRSTGAPRDTARPASGHVLNIAALLLLTAAAIPLLMRLEFTEDVRSWLPDDDPQSRMLDWQQQLFPAGESMVVSWKGATLADDRVAALVESLNQSDWATRVSTPQELIARMTDNWVSEAEARRRLVGAFLGSVNKSDPEQTAVGVLIEFKESNDNEVRSYLDDLTSRAEAVGIPPEDLHVGGGPVAAQELDRRLAMSRWNSAAPWWRPDQKSPLVLSAVAALVLAMALLRRIRLTAVVLSVTLCATLLGVALLPLTGRAMNMVLTVMPTLLMVLTLSAAIHVANYRRHAASLGQDPRRASETARRLAFWPCMLAAVTTAVGLLSLLTSSLRPVREFGIYSAIGVMIGLAAALYSLPAALAVLPIGKPSMPGREAAYWQRLGRLIARHGTPVAVVTLLCSAAATAGLVWFRTDTRVISYFPDDSSIVADYTALEEQLGGLIPVEIAVVFDDQTRSKISLRERVERVRAVEEAVRQAPGISGALGLPDFVARPQDLPAARRIPANARLRTLEKDITSGRDSEVSRFVTRVKTPLVGANDQVLAAVGDEVWIISAQADMLSKIDFAHLTERLTEISHQPLADLPGATTFVTGTVPLFLRTQQAVLNSLVVSFGLAFVLIAIVMIAVLRSIPAGLLAMLPNLMPIVGVFGLIAWCDQAVDIGMMITASVALGIAVDGTLHLLTWFRESQAAGESRSEAIATALGHCGPAMWQTSGIVGLSLLMLSFAPLLLISRFGWLMAALIFAALFADLVFLPALLGSQLGRVFDSPPQTDEGPVNLSVENAGHMVKGS